MKGYHFLFLFSYILALMAFLGQINYPSSSWGAVFIPAFAAAIMASVQAFILDRYK